MSLARKYRPRNFADLVGQEAVSKTLSQALNSDKLTHAYLFSGIRGSGKTSTARIFAKALICDNGPTSTPCETCQNCQMANDYRHIDIIEMDAASNRGIEDIKELIEHTKYKPSIARFKIFIIDEVHMLTIQAFNALLKTLEEPPDFVKFILATTDPLKLPATILSRTQHFRFKKIPQKTAREHLEFILDKEGIEFEESALEIIARAGQGSLRDSLTLLDQAIVYANGKIETSIVTNMLGVVEPKVLDDLLKNILNRDKDNILKFLEDFTDYEVEMIIDELTIYLKDALLNGDTRFNTLVIDRFFRILADSKSLLSIGSSEDFVLSLTLFKMIEAVNILDIDEMIHNLQNELKGSNATKNIQHTEIKSSEQTLKVEDKKIEYNQQAIEKEKTVKQVVAPQNNSENGELKFKTLIEKIYDRNYDLGEVFKNCVSFVSYENGILVWESSANDEEKKRLRTGWGVIKLFVQDIFGLDTKIKPIQKKKIDKPIEENESNRNIANTENVNISNNEEQQKSSCIMPEPVSLASRDTNPQNLLKEPLVEELIKHFDPKRVVIKQKS